MAFNVIDNFPVIRLACLNKQHIIDQMYHISIKFKIARILVMFAYKLKQNLSHNLICVHTCSLLCLIEDCSIYWM